MNFSHISKEKLLYILVNRTVIFFFLMCLLTLFLYAAGTSQVFIDSTQLALLKLCESLGIFLMVTSACGMALDVGRFIKTRRKRYALRAGGYALLVIFAAAEVFAVMTIAAFSLGGLS